MSDQDTLAWSLIRVVAPMVIFLVVFFCLFLLTELGVIISAAIAGGIAILDFVVFTFLMKRSEDS